MQSARDSAIGLPSSSTSASWMLGLLMPDEQRRNFTMPPVSSTAGETFPCAYGSVSAVEGQATENSTAPARSSLPASDDIPEHWRRRPSLPTHCQRGPTYEESRSA